MESTPGCSCRLRGHRQECLQFIIDARCPEIWFFLKRTANVVHDGVTCVKQHKGKNEIIRLVQAGQNLVLGDGDGLGPLHSSLRLNEPEQTRVRNTGLDVVTEILITYILRYEAKIPFGVHDSLHGTTFGLRGFQSKGWW